MLECICCNVECVLHIVPRGKKISLQTGVTPSWCQLDMIPSFATLPWLRCCYLSLIIKSYIVNTCTHIHNIYALILQGRGFYIICNAVRISHLILELRIHFIPRVLTLLLKPLKKVWRFIRIYRSPRVFSPWKIPINLPHHLMLLQCYHISGLCGYSKYILPYKIPEENHGCESSNFCWSKWDDLNMLATWYSPSHSRRMSIVASQITNSSSFWSTACLGYQRKRSLFKTKYNPCLQNYKLPYIYVYLLQTTLAKNNG